MQKRTVSRYFAVFFMGFLVSLFAVYALQFAHIPSLSLGEPGKYIEPAKGLFETGRYVYWHQGQYLPALDRLPGYPAFLALSYLLFGIDHYMAVLLFQCLLMGSIVLAIALSTRMIAPKFMWPAAILATLCPNLVFRAATVMLDLLFAFFIAWGLCGLMASLQQGKHNTWFLVITTLCFSLAFYVRPAFLLYPIFTLLFLPYLFRSYLKYSVTKSCLYSLALFVSLAILVAPQFIRLHQYTGHYTISIQGPAHLLMWGYPSLAPKWGGKRNIENLKLAKQALLKQSAQQANQHLTRAQGYDSEKKLAESLIKALPVSRIMTAAIGSSLKLLMYTSFIGIMESFHQQVVSYTLLATAPSTFFKKVFSNPWAVALLISQMLLLVMRALQIIGIIYGIRHRQFRALTLYLLAAALSFVVVSVSIGNPLYRAPMEPMLILFAVLGMVSVLDYWKKRKVRQDKSSSLIASALNKDV